MSGFGYASTPDRAVLTNVYLASPQTILKGGGFYDILNIEGRGMVHSVLVITTLVHPIFIEIELLCDGIDVLSGELDNLEELINRLGIGHKRKGFPIFTKYDSFNSSCRILWHPENAKYEKTLQLRIFNNHASVDATLGSGSGVRYFNGSI